MATVLESLRLVVRWSRPAARCTHQRGADGWRMYQIVDDAGPITGRHHSMVSAWGEAGEILQAERDAADARKWEG